LKFFFVFLNIFLKNSWTEFGVGTCGKKSEHILSRALLTNIILSASIIIAGVLWVMKEILEDDHMTERERTMTFTAFIFFDMFNALASR